jgi:hypothetical protein
MPPFVDRPGKMRLLAPTAEPLVPDPLRLSDEPQQTAEIAADPEVVEQERPVGDPNFDHPLQFVAIQTVGEGDNIGLYDPAHLASMHDLVKGTDGIMGTATAPESVGAVQRRRDRRKARYRLGGLTLRRAGLAPAGR